MSKLQLEPRELGSAAWARGVAVELEDANSGGELRSAGRGRGVDADADADPDANADARGPVVPDGPASVGGGCVAVVVDVGVGVG